MPESSEIDSPVESIHLLFASAENPPTPSQLKKLKERIYQFIKENYEKIVFGGFGVLDGFNMAYSMPRSVFDMLNANKDTATISDLMRDWMASPEGIACMLFESLFFMGSAFLGNIYDEDDPNNVKRYIAIYWPYLRDILKALKNGYKGIRGALVVSSIVSGLDLRHIAVPFGIVLGVTLAVNRVWLRNMRGVRKAFINKNERILEAFFKNDFSELEQFSSFQDANFEDIETLLRFKKAFAEVVAEQEAWQERQKIRAYLAEIYGGLVDGIYLFMGAATVATGASLGLMIGLLVVSVLYVSLNILSRVYDEYKARQELKETQLKMQLVLLSQEIIFKTNQLWDSGEVLKRDSPELAALNDLLDEYYQKRMQLKNDQSCYKIAVFAGLKNGLVAYGAVASIMFGTSAIFLMAGAAFPPALMAVCIFSGLLLIGGFIIREVQRTYKRLQEKKDDAKEDIWKNLKAKYEQSNAKETLKSVKTDEFKLIEKVTTAELDEILCATKRIAEKTPEEIKALKNDIIAAMLYGRVNYFESQVLIKEYGEMGRTIGASLSKAQKGSALALPFFQEKIGDHYHDTAPIFVGTAVFGGLFIGGLASKAYVKEVLKRKKETKKKISQNELIVRGPEDKSAEAPTISLKNKIKKPANSRPPASAGFFLTRSKQKEIPGESGQLKSDHEGPNSPPAAQRSKSVPLFSTRNTLFRIASQVSLPVQFQRSNQRTVQGLK